MKEDYNQMIDAIEQAYIRDFENRQEAAGQEAERLERERIERERLEAERLEKERIERERLKAGRIEQERLEKERQKALRKEQARLEEEARIVAEQAKLAEFFRNAPEVALKMTEDIKHQKEEQEALKRTLDANQQKNDDMFKQLIALLNEKFEMINARLPPPP
jgi:hypothetical protein